MPLTLKTINAELGKRGHSAFVVKGSGYFYFRGGEAGGWLDKTVSVPKVSSLTLEHWVAEFERLKKLNAAIMRTAKKPRP